MPIRGAVNKEQTVKIGHKVVKNPNWWEAADQLAIYKRGRGVETRDCRVINLARGQVGN